MGKKTRDGPKGGVGNAIKEMSTTTVTTTTTTSGEGKWTSSEGGNLLTWLSQVAPQQQKQNQQSRGAIDYLNKANARKNAKASKSSAGRPPAAETTSTKPEVPKPRSLQQPQQQKDQDNAGTNAVEKLAALFPEKQVKEAPAPNAKVGNPIAARVGAEGPKRNEKERRNETVRAQRHRGEREVKKERLQRRLEMMKEAQKFHEEALRTDPEYQKRFQTFQELQAAQQVAHSTFLDRYAKQGSLNINTIVSERIDIPVILNLIDQHDVVFICTDTGSGKSTSVPKALLELSNDTRVVSTQPRRTATVSIATRVAELRREAVGEDVGYWIRGDKCGDVQTRLWYMTSYTLLLHLLNTPLRPPFTHIVLDEFHERQPDIEVTVALLRLCLLRRTAQFKLILMSATLDTEGWEAYFAGLKVATYKQSEPKHLIHDYFMEDVCTLVGTMYDEPPNIVQRGVEYPLMEKHTAIAQALLLYLNTCTDPQHAILVFLPGRGQVEQMHMWLELNLRKPVDIIPWHSAVDLSVIQEAIKRRGHNRQKIYLATDIAEVSITLPDVVFVIDMVLVKRPKVNKENPATVLHPPLMTQWVSKGNIAQRRGRIGRVQQGFYFCLLSAEAVAALPEHMHPPIENSRIDELSLHCLQLVSNPVAIFSICHGQPLLETIATAMDTLCNLGCILHRKDPLAVGECISEIHTNSEWSPLVLEEAKNVVFADIDEYEYTFVGRLLQLIPVSPLPGMLVLYGFFTGLESLTILAAAVTSSLSPFAPNQPEKKRRWRHDVAGAMEETENSMREMCCGMRSDILAVMKAVLLFRVQFAKSGEDVTAAKMWCAQHHLSYDKLRSILDLEQHIKYELANFIPVRDVPDATVLLNQLEKAAAVMLVMTNVAFVSQALEVVSEGNTYQKTKETAVGIFMDVVAVPDIHSPSCLRWQEGEIIVPVQLSLMGNKMLASFSTAISSHKQFWLSLLLLTHKVMYAVFADDEGEFYVFSVKYYSTERYLETDAATGSAILQFRQMLSSVGQALRLLRDYQHLYDDEFADVLNDHGLKPLRDMQCEVVTAMAAFFNNTENITVDEVEHEEDDLDEVSMISLALPKRG
ncbi:ATP-dependent RNA helicase, putative [Trypanosoma brucei gambiense DAL972]|uniref:ATP-dependent RNA helicase, putative n=2 Tax=Trypanosoma brucei TaxID=5691 RepID=C9ZN47_TRYB9|nr:ATP-dependent RNA helicase, putative [Trypanosoma brucei gambiense DAL972]RHW73263.1 ATP-dependent RNA helicase [Trypanosoma brucei equiperdum]CBH10701.1 ATP-dependent RNA helicase, putative [Trypanosoma brucei gambiense DAL972]|eukprot:XP_011772989.1 ATP-dependent RNA helicase, putative [Trypanosoma brucei gambiense DAL972]